MTISDEDDLLAGEYVLGSLDRDARTSASARRLADPEFDAAVALWESRLVSIDEASPGIEPPAHLWTAIVARIRALGDQVAQSVPSLAVARLGRQLLVWRRIAAASMALAAALALWVAVMYSAPPRAGQTLVAVLQPSGQQPAFLMKADLQDRQMSVRTISAPPVPGKSYELWIIDPALGPPKSLGVLDTPASARAKLPDLSPDVLARATYAVTIEAQGGSPTGAPSGAPVFVGHLLRSDL